jgi:replicative DNA helicase
LIPSPGCSRGSAFDENKKEFAGPIYWLSNNNGRLFPGCTILLIHHANKTGGFRGSTAIRDAVDEVWGLRRPDKGQQERGLHNARLITVEKSRAGRDGSKLLMKLEDDLTFSLTDYVEQDQESNNPASIVDKVLQRIRAVLSPVS